MSTNANIDLNQTPAAFDAAYASLLVAAKQNYDSAGNLVGALPSTLATRYITAEVANAWDDMHRAMQGKVGGTIINVRERAYGAIGDGVEDDTAAIQAAITAAGEGDCVFFPPGTYLCDNLEISGKSQLVIRGNQATIQWNATGTEAGLELIGTCTDVLIQGLRIVGSGDAADLHRGVYSGSGQTLTRIIVDNCVIEDVPVGISFNSDLGGSIRGCVASNNRLSNIVGTSSGQGYGLHVADGSAGYHGTVLINNTITQAHRHSIYIARGFGCRVIGNTIDQHRLGDSTGSTLPAIAIGRGGDHFFTANLVTRANNVGLMIDAGSGGEGDIRNVAVVGNIFSAPAGIHPHLYVGENITPDGDIHAVTIDSNVFDSDAVAVDAIRLHWGHGVTVANNTIRIRDIASTVYAIRLAANGESAFSAADSSRWVISNNQIQITDAGGGGSSCAFFLTTPFVNASGTDVRFDANSAIVPGNMFAVAANIENPNITVSMQPITGLTYATGVAQLGYNEVATALQVTGNITMLGASSIINLGSQTVSGNAGLRFDKADANNQTTASWYSANTFQWLLQHDTSENLNVLDSAATVALQLQRTGGYVRHANGTRIGGASGPLDLQGSGSPDGAVTAGPGSTYRDATNGVLYVKVTGTGNTGWSNLSTGSTTLVDIDATAAATSDWVAGGAGTYAFGGVNWTVANTTAADTFGLVNATGLRFNASATNGAYTTSARSAAYLRVPVATLIPTFDVMGTYVIEVYLSSVTFGTSANRIYFGIENDTGGTDRMIGGGRRNTSGTQQTYVTIDAAGTILGNAATHDALAVRFNAASVSGYSGAYSAGFPTYQLSGGHASHADSVVNAVGADSTNYFFIAFISGETGAAMDCTLARYRIRRVDG